MGSHVQVYVRDVEVLSWRDEIDPTLLFLFTADDVRRVPKDPDEREDYDDADSILLIVRA